MGDEEVQHEYGAINTLLIVFVLSTCMLCGYMLRKHKIYYIPESAAAMVVGAVVGGVARIVSDQAELTLLRFHPELFFFLLLPPIIFEAGYSLKKKQFFRNLSTILLFAVIGTLISTFIVGGLTYGFAKAGWITMDPTSPLQSLLFGALISAVDPVATLSIIGNPELDCDPMLYSLVFGESVLNDAVAIVLFRTFMGFVGASEEFTGSDIWLVIGRFLGISLGSIVMGVTVGLICSLMCKYTDLGEHDGYEVALLFMMAYASYAISEAVGLSGIMSLFFCGIVLSHYNWYNLSADGQISSSAIFKSVAMVSETLVFAYMGVVLFTGDIQRWDCAFVVLGILSCLFARLFNTFPLSWLVNLRRKKPIPRNMQGVIWFAGLRGAIAFALAFNMPEPNKHWDRGVVVSTTLGVCFFTTIVCGGLTETVLRVAGVQGPGSSGSQGSAAQLLASGREEEEEDGEAQAEYHLTSGEDGDGSPAARERRDEMEVEDSEHVAGGVHSRWKHFDRRYMQPIFGGHHNPRPPLPNEVIRHESTASEHDIAMSTMPRRAEREGAEGEGHHREGEARRAHPPPSQAAASAFGAE